MAASNSYARVLLQAAYDGRGNGTLLTAIQSKQASLASKNGRLSSSSANGVAASFAPHGVNLANEQLTLQLVRDTYNEAITNGFTDDSAGVAALFTEMMWQLEPCAAFETQHTTARLNA